MSTCASLCFSHAKQIREDLIELEQQAKVNLPTCNHRSLTQGDKEKGEDDKSALGSTASEQWFLVYPTLRTLIS